MIMMVWALFLTAGISNNDGQVIENKMKDLREGLTLEIFYIFPARNTSCSYYFSFFMCLIEKYFRYFRLILINIYLAVIRLNGKIQ